MIRTLFGLFFFISVVMASGDMSFENSKKVYTIQLFSVSKHRSKKIIMRNVPSELRDEFYLHKVKDLVAGRYSQAMTYKKILPALKKVKKAGFKDACVIATTKRYMPIKNEKAVLKKPTKKIISKYIISQMIVKANRAYKNGNKMQAMIYYEMLLSTGVKSKKIKKNLCYLYGEKGAWEQAKDVIDKERYQLKLIYAYANGAVKTLQPNFYKNLKEYIMLDRSGHIALLAGYYFEQKYEMKKALEFYKRAYEKNRNDKYNSYAYARYLDITGKKQEALRLYKMLYGQTREESEIHKAIQSRL